MLQKNTNLFYKYSVYGIPPNLTAYLDPIKLVEAEEWPYVIQEHEAERAGYHYDLRMGEPGRDIVHSFGIPKGKLPEVNEKLLAIQGPIHTPEALKFEGPIPFGYGKGTIKTKDKGIMEVIESDPFFIRFNIYKGKDTNEYLLRKWEKFGDKNWILMNVSPTRKVHPEISKGKPSYKHIKLKDVKFDEEEVLMQPKVSGAHTYIFLRPERHIRQISHRPSKRREELITHTWRNPAFVNYKSPIAATVRSELFAVDKTGKAIPESQVSSLLNMSVPKARRKLRDEGWTFKNLLFDVISYKGKNVEDLPYNERYKILKELTKYVPYSEIPVSAKTKEEKQRLFWAIQSKEFPLTEEGVVLWSAKDPAQRTPKKVKFREEEVVRIEDVFKGLGKLEGVGAGGFAYTGPGGAKGRVGSGFTEQQRKEMWEKPEEWVGKRAIIKSYGQSARGKRKVPIFQYLHI